LHLPKQGIDEFRWWKLDNIVGSGKAKAAWHRGGDLDV